MLCSLVRVKSQKFETEREVQNPLPGPAMLLARCPLKGTFCKDTQICVQTLLHQTQIKPLCLGPGLLYLEVSAGGIAAMFVIVF